VLVVGGGPAGTAAAIRLGEQGHLVTIVERSTVPRAKACGELLSPRAVTALDQLGVHSDFHRIDHVRFTCGDHTTSVPWPQHEQFADHGVVAPRAELDGRLLDAARCAGAMLLAGHEATAPIVERGFVRGAHVSADDGREFELRATFTIVADGANSTFGRALGTFRDPRWPHALAHRAIFESDLHAAAEVELVLDLHDRAGTAIAGYGWMAPRGDGAVNVGVMIMSTSPSFRVISPAHVLDRFVEAHATRWRLSPRPIEPAAGGRIPLGNSIGPVAGPTYLVVGDAGAAANPMSGAGIEYALETGALAGEVVNDALSGGSTAELQNYPRLVRERYDSYFKFGRLANRALGRPTINHRIARLLVRRNRVADSLLRLAGNELRSSRRGGAETVYRLARMLSVVIPEA